MEVFFQGGKEIIHEIIEIERTTHLMQQASYLDADSSSEGQENPHLLLSTKTNYCVNKNSSLARILGLLIPAHTRTFGLLIPHPSAGQSVTNTI